MKNIELAGEILRSLWAAGVRHIVLCAGARNAPFVARLSAENPFRVHPFFEERSGGFFALGRSVRDRRPVAVITTSGTAAANLLPAAIEADYQGLPLVLITADRPAHYRGSGAPQTINQLGLYSHYVERSWDVQGEWNATLEWSRRRPVHLNICFDEPLIDAPVESLQCEKVPVENRSAAVSGAQQSLALATQYPLVIVGGLSGEREAIVAQLKSWRRPLVLEAPSGLRGHPDLNELEILAADKTLKNLKYDSVIRIGSVPTHRLWRELEKSALPVFHFSDLPFSGLPRAREVKPLCALATVEANFQPWDPQECRADREMAVRERELLRKHSLSEPAWIEWLSRQIPPQAKVFIGNSLPIREWDFVAVRDGRREVFANRGANGIDGLISTFIGLADEHKSNWCVLGDLSALYDLSGPWPNLREKIRDLNIVIVNNSGGKIFKRLFHNSLFENPHSLGFKHWAEMWGWEYELLNEPRTLQVNAGPRVLEIVPEEKATENFWREWEDLK